MEQMMEMKKKGLNSWTFEPVLTQSTNVKMSSMQIIPQCFKMRMQQKTQKYKILKKNNGEEVLSIRINHLRMNLFVW